MWTWCTAAPAATCSTPPSILPGWSTAATTRIRCTIRPRFQAYAHALAERLVADYDLRGKRIVEIACGQGDFLSLLCKLGGNRGIGFDPSYTPGRGLAGETAAHISFVKSYYTDAYADAFADLICCRHALEHMAQPVAFLRAIRRALGTQSAAVYFEVPNAAYNLVDLGVWDLIYEHCGYFTAASLAEAFRRGGFASRGLRASSAASTSASMWYRQPRSDGPSGPVARHLEPSAGFGRPPLAIWGLWSLASARPIAPR